MLDKKSWEPLTKLKKIGNLHNGAHIILGKWWELRLLFYVAKILFYLIFSFFRLQFGLAVILNLIIGGSGKGTEAR